MAYDHAEEEQLASLKAWWNQYGNLVTWLLIIVLAAYAAWAGWGVYQRNQSAQAAQLYEELQKAVTAQDKEKIQRVATDMEEKFSRTAYAQMSGLTAAKSAFDSNDFKTAKAQLQWVADKGSAEYKAVAKIRLAGILLDEKSYDEGLKVLAGDFPAEFAGVVSDRKGDIFVAQNKLDEARTAYHAALEKTDAQNPGRQLIQIKLDAIGGAPVKKAA
ncbi:MAG: tetratricopeptide repeat protein [Herminiimonas sp.]|uniref:tetratricopeptide repeat protein n=1 Tax=Herminiimonas sp. TaxID=1926289 RepID=UPI0027262F11|nr:tetratricopeptide repeat protein [Herminiimonas sp.]MDO9419659.1 tetratricopeptide repeat protein [Herminiimonas sp.]